MPRLFVGIPIEKSLTNSLNPYIEQVLVPQKVKGTSANKLHVTLYFFSEVPVEMYDNLISLLSLALQNLAPFSLVFDRLMLAPSGKAPRMVWARYQKGEQFVQLSNEIHRLYQQIQPEIQRRKSPIPHITLGRFKEVPDSSLLELDRKFSDIRVQELVLWESVQHEGGSSYKVRKIFPLLSS